jgi:hypothetical protein
MTTEHRDGDFLIWLRDRLVNIYGEPANVDFVLRLEGIANSLGAQRHPFDSDEESRYVLIRREDIIEANKDYYTIRKRDLPKPRKRKN